MMAKSTGRYPTGPVSDGSEACGQIIEALALSALPIKRLALGAWTWAILLDDLCFTYGVRTYMKEVLQSLELLLLSFRVRNFHGVVDDKGVKEIIDVLNSACNVTELQLFDLSLKSEAFSADRRFCSAFAKEASFPTLRKICLGRFVLSLAELLNFISRHPSLRLVLGYCTVYEMASVEDLERGTSDTLQDVLERLTDLECVHLHECKELAGPLRDEGFSDSDESGSDEE